MVFSQVQSLPLLSPRFIKFYRDLSAHAWVCMCERQDSGPWLWGCQSEEESRSVSSTDVSSESCSPAGDEVLSWVLEHLAALWVIVSCTECSCVLYCERWCLIPSDEDLLWRFNIFDTGSGFRNRTHLPAKGL